MNLVPLFEEALEFQNYNGSVLSNGKVAVFYIGRTRLADIFNDVEGLSPAENPKVLDNLGMGPLYVNPAFDYELIVYDAYDNEMFSVKKYLHSKGEHSTANVVVTPSENIAVSAWRIGDVQVYMPYLTGDVGKTYEGIDPIVVNNEYNRISANHIPLGVQDPLYFVEDSESACIIGMSGGIVPEGTMTESGLGFENNKITGYNGSAFSAGNDYKAGSYVDITDNTISVTGLSPLPADTASTGLVASVSADITAMIPDTSDMATQTWVNEQGFLTAHQDISNKLDTTAFSTVSGNFLTAHQSLVGYATEEWVEGKGYLTGVDIPESANWNGATTVVNNNSAIWNNTTNIVSANSAQWTEGSTANPQIPVTGINGIKISESGDKVVFEVSGDYATNAQLADKLDTTALNSNVDPITISYSAKPTEEPIYASGNQLKNVDYIDGKAGLAIVPNGVLQVPNIITAANGNLIVQNAITATNGNLIVQNVITAAQNGVLQVPNVITATPQGLTAAGLSANSAYGLTANGLTADAYTSGFSAIGISAGKQGPLCIQGAYESISSTNHEGFTFSSQNTTFGTAQLGTAQYNSIVHMSAPKFEARNISGAGFSIEASGAKGYDESGNVVWDTYYPKVKNIICYNDTLTAAGGLTGSIILTVMPSTNASNLTSAPYVIMDASQASYFAAYGPSAQTPTVSLMPNNIMFTYQAGNAKTTVGYNDIKQESGGSSWTLTGSVQKRELEYDAKTSAITAIAGSAIGGDCGGSALPISAGHGIKFELIDNTLVASVTSTPTSGYVWRSASLFHTDTPVTQTTYTLSDNCSNYDRLDVDFYDVNNWRTVMECPIPSNLDASGTRGGYFSVVPASTATGADIWFKAFNWTAAGTTWSCYCSELAGKGGSTTQTINANQPSNPPKVVNIIGWKRVGGN